MSLPFVYAALHLNLFLSGLHTISTVFVFVWFCCMFWVIFISCGVKDVWTFGPMIPTFHPFLGLGVAWAKALSSPCFFFLVSVGLLAIDPAISLHRTCYSFTSLFISCYPVGLRANAPTVPAHFFINFLLIASLTHFPYLYHFWALLANIPTLLAHFIPWPIYFFFTYFTSIGFLLNPLGFLDLITTFLPLTTLRAYWPLSQSNEFTNSFTSHLPLIVSMGLLLHSLGFINPFTSSLLVIILVDLLAIIPAILSYWACFTIFSPHFLHIVGLLLLLGPLLKVGINTCLAIFFL